MRTNISAFLSEFLLNHLHSSHKHRRYNGDTLDLTMVVPQIETEISRPCRHSTSSKDGGSGATPGSAVSNGSSSSSATQTWPFVEIYSFKRHFYLEAQSFAIDGHTELFLWLWFLGKWSNAFLQGVPAKVY